MTDWMECWEKARERVVKATFVGAGKEGLCPQMQNPRLRRGIFIYNSEQGTFLVSIISLHSENVVV